MATLISSSIKSSESCHLCELTPPHCCFGKHAACWKQGLQTSVWNKDSTLFFRCFYPFLMIPIQTGDFMTSCCCNALCSVSPPTGDEQSLLALWDHSDRCCPQPGRRHSAVHHRGIFNVINQSRTEKYTLSLCLSLCLRRLVLLRQNKVANFLSVPNSTLWLHFLFFFLIFLSLCPWCFQVIALQLNS